MQTHESSGLFYLHIHGFGAWSGAALPQSGLADLRLHMRQPGIIYGHAPAAPHTGPLSPIHGEP